MTEKTLKYIQDTAIAYLYLPLKFDERLPFIAIHPFANSQYQVIEGKMIDLGKQEQYQEWILKMKKMLRKSTLEEIFNILDRRYFFDFLKCIEKWLDEIDMAKILSEHWQRIEYISCNTIVSTKKIIRWFKFANKKTLMGKDYRVFSRLADEIIVYRGVSDYNKKNKKAVSWTLSKEKAIWFANRFDNTGKEVWKLKVSKKHLLCFFSYEKEVVVNLTDVPFSQYEIINL